MLIASQFITKQVHDLFVFL